MRRWSRSCQRMGNTKPQRPRRQKLSKDLDGGSDSNRTLRHRPIHGHNQVRGQDIREGEIRNREYQGFSILRKNIQSRQLDQRKAYRSSRQRMGNPKPKTETYQRSWWRLCPERTIRLNWPKLTKRKLFGVPDQEREIRNRRQKLSKDHDGGSDPERTLRPNHSRPNWPKLTKEKLIGVPDRERETWRWKLNERTLPRNNRQGQST